MKRLLSTAIVAAFVATPVLAETAAMTRTDLNLYAGPGADSAVAGSIPAGMAVSVDSCSKDDVNWCKVSYEGGEGWVHGRFFQGAEGIDLVSMDAEWANTTQVVIESEPDNAPAAGATFGMGAAAMLAGGPATIIAAGIAGAALADATDPGPEVVAYVTENPVEPTVLNGELVVGNRIPESVELHTVPDSEFAYLSVNGVPVIVEPGERTIVTIIR